MSDVFTVKVLEAQQNEANHLKIWPVAKKLVVGYQLFLDHRSNRQQNKSACEIFNPKRDTVNSLELLFRFTSAY